MAQKGRILVGTIGQGIMTSVDDGANWTRVSGRAGLYSEGIVRALVSDPQQPHNVYAGTAQGLFQSNDGGARWNLLDGPMTGAHVWSIAIDSVDPNILFAGTGNPSKAGIYRSTDAGKSWKELSVPISDTASRTSIYSSANAAKSGEKASIAAAETASNIVIPAPTGIAIDPTDSNKVWVGFEVDGVRHSSDGGETWSRVNGQIPNEDIHNVLVVAGPPKTVFAVVSDDIWRSVDDGKTWHSAHARETFPWHYTRRIAAKPNDPKTVFLTLGDSTPGCIGTVVRSKDAGVSWETASLPVQPNSAMWTLNIPSAEPDLVFAASRFGYLYRSDDGGDSWRKLWREFGEVSSVLWVPE